MMCGLARLSIFSIVALLSFWPAEGSNDTTDESVYHSAIQHAPSFNPAAGTRVLEQPRRAISNSRGVTGRSLDSNTQDSESAASTSRIFLIQRGHLLTPRLVAQAVLAKRQILAAGGAYHFMLKSAHQRDPLQPSTASFLNLALLRDALGFRHVSHVIASDIIKQFPGLVEWSTAYGLGGGYERTSSDVFDYALYSRFKSDGTLPSWVTQVWLMEWDVAWTGNLPDILTKRFDPNFGYIGHYPVHATVLRNDATCVSKHCEFWELTKVRTWPPSDTDVYHATAMMLRLDVRLLDSLVRHYEHGEWLFNEAAGATVCIIGESSWCKVDWGFMPGHPALGQLPGSNVSMFAWNYHLNDSLWVKTLQEFEDRRAKDPNILGQLYHALKW